MADPTALHIWAWLNARTRKRLLQTSDWQTTKPPGQALTQARQDLSFAERHDIALISLQPSPAADNAATRVSTIPDAPLALWLRGHGALLDDETRPWVAIVGARQASVSGRRLAYDFAAALARAGAVVVSGLAFGVDRAAHEGALSVGGVTVAVLGSGLARVYPAAHRQLAEQIAGSGLLVSEYAPSAEPRKHHFPERNRLISGLCCCVLVVEATQKSGSLVTARMALEQGRDVLAVPGAVSSPLSAGCHQLLRDGAGLVHDVETLFGELGMEATAAAANNDVVLDDLPQRVLAALHHLTAGGVSCSQDQLAETLKLPIEALCEVLLSLELDGFVSPTADGYIALPQNS